MSRAPQVSQSRVSRFNGSVIDVDGMRPTPTDERTDKRIRVLVADQSMVLSDALTRIISDQEDMIALDYWDGTSLYRSVYRKNIHVLVYDPYAYTNGFMSITKVKEWNPTVKIIALSSTLQDAKIVNCIRAGVGAFVSKLSSVDNVLSAIRAISSDQGYMTNDFVSLVLEEVKNMKFNIEGVQFTPRELSVTQMVCRGSSNFIIGQELGLTEKTVKNYVSDIYKKMDVNNRTQLAVKAIQSGLPIIIEDSREGRIDLEERVHIA